VRQRQRLDEHPRLEDGFAACERLVLQSRRDEICDAREEEGIVPHRHGGFVDSAAGKPDLESGSFTLHKLRRDMP
jgi:hypothetical protein